MGILAALGLGLGVGFINGLLVIRTNVPSFVVTLATLFAVAGLTLGLSVILTGSTSVALRSRTGRQDAVRRLCRRQVRGDHLLVDRRRR